jgi:UDP-glucose 4-epimerase
LRDEPVTVFGDGEQTRDFVYVDDVVDAFVRGATKGGGLVCNVGTGHETSVNRLLGEMAAQAGVSARITQKPLRPGELQRSALDPSRAGIQLGWRSWTDLGTGTAAVLEYVGRQLATGGGD